MRKKIVFILMLLFVNTRTFALTYNGCDYSSLARLKSLVRNINISYDYKENGYVRAFSVTLNNITPDMYFEDSITDKTYLYSNTNDGEITITYYGGISGAYKFYSNLKECSSSKLGTMYYTFPTYNSYYKDPLCEGIETYRLCQKWADINLDYTKFTQAVNGYKKSLTKTLDKKVKTNYKKRMIDVVVDVYIKYYYYFFVSIIAVCLIIILVKRKKDKFDI